MQGCGILPGHGRAGAQRPWKGLPQQPLCVLCGAILCFSSPTAGARERPPLMAIRAMAELGVLDRLLGSGCSDWRWDRYTGRLNCTGARSLHRGFAADLNANRPREMACREPAAQFQGGAPALLCSDGVRRPGYICSRVLADGWEFDANGQLDLIVYWLFFRGLGRLHRSRRFVEFGAQNGVGVNMSSCQSRDHMCKATTLCLSPLHRLMAPNLRCHARVHAP